MRARLGRMVSAVVLTGVILAGLAGCAGADLAAEYVGTFISNDSYQDLAKDRTSIHRNCLSLEASYVGVPDDGMLKYRSGTAYSVPSSTEWAAGDHGVRCHLYLSKIKTSSLKGVGTKGLPINYV